MKKIYYGMVAGLLALASCTTEDKVDIQEVDALKSFTTLNATIADIPSTRASIVDGSTELNKSIVWDEADKIYVFSDVQATLAEYEYSGEDDNGVAYFLGDEVKGNQFYAVYSPNDFGIDQVNPTVIHFDNSDCWVSNQDEYFFAGPMIATSSDNTFAFKQTLSLVHFTIKDILTNVNNIQAIYLYGNADEVIRGTGTIDLASNNPVFVLDEEAQGSTVAAYIDEADDEEGIDVYFALPPMTFNHGFTLEIVGEDVTGKEIRLTKYASAPLTLDRAAVKHYSEIEFAKELEDQAVLEANQRGALMDFYNAFGGDQWIFNTNWGTNAPLNEWYGVTVNRGKVIGLDISWNNLTAGEIPESFSDLKYLESLNLQSTKLEGQSLTNICGLKNLTSLVLAICEIDEELPAAFYTLENLQEVDFLSAKMKGTLSSDLSKLTKLRSLNLSDCNLSGTLPQSLATMTNLEELNLNYNHFTGDISFLGNMTWLTKLCLLQNEFESIPASIWNLTNLKVLHLSGISSIPSSIGQMKDLFYLVLKGDFTDTPATMANLSKLVDLTLYGQLSSIPTWISGMTDMYFLSLSDNKISGDLPEWIGNLTKLENLYLQNNKITGDIPTSFYNLTMMKMLDLSYNFMTIKKTETLETWLNGMQYYDIDNQNSAGNVDIEEEFGGQSHDWN